MALSKAFIVRGKGEDNRLFGLKRLDVNISKHYICYIIIHYMLDFSLPWDR